MENVTLPSREKTTCSSLAIGRPLQADKLSRSVIVSSFLCDNLNLHIQCHLFIYALFINF